MHPGADKYSSRECIKIYNFLPFSSTWGNAPPPGKCQEKCVSLRGGVMKIPGGSNLNL